MRFWRQFKRSPKGQFLLATSVALILVILALPWPLGLDAVLDGSFFGIPTGYFLATLVFPIAMLVLTFWYSLIASEIEPFVNDSEDQR